MRFAQVHDGVQLYVDDLSDTVGVELYRSAEPERRTAEMKQGMSDMGWEEEDLPEWFATGVAIGEMSQSGNYLVVETAGDNAGKILYADHDDWPGSVG